MENRYSNVWSHFTIVDDKFAKCDICKKKYSYKSTLTNLKKHLCNKHLIPCDPAQQTNNQTVHNKVSLIKAQFIFFNLRRKKIGTQY